MSARNKDSKSFKEITLGGEKYYRLIRRIGRYAAGQIVTEKTLDNLLEEYFLELL